jgi:hypothetical protein
MMIFLAGSKMFDALADNIDYRRASAPTRIIPEVVGQIEAWIGQDKVWPAGDANLPLNFHPIAQELKSNSHRLFWWDSSALVKKTPGLRAMRDWIDKLSFRARAAIIAVVFALTVLSMMDNWVKSLADLGKNLLEMAVAATSW